MLDPNRVKEFNDNLAAAITKGNEVSSAIQKQLIAQGFTVSSAGSITRDSQQNIWVTLPSESAPWKERVRLWLENPYGGVRWELHVELHVCNGERSRTRKFKNFSEANIKKMAKDMRERIEDYKASIERQAADASAKAAWAVLRHTTLRGLIVPPCARVQIVQEGDGITSMPLKDREPKFVLEFSTYGTTSIRNLQFSREQLAMIFDGFAKAMRLDTSWVIRFTSSETVSGRKMRNYYTGSWVTPSVNESRIYATEEEAKQAIDKLPSSLKLTAQACLYADEFLPDPSGVLVDAQVRG